MKRGVRNAERGTTSLRCTTLTRKDYISAERGTRNAERLHSANATLTRKDYISAVMVLALDKSNS